jgi:hypothetical protein
VADAKLPGCGVVAGLSVSQGRQVPT